MSHLDNVRSVVLNSPNVTLSPCGDPQSSNYFHCHFVTNFATAVNCNVCKCLICNYSERVVQPQRGQDPHHRLRTTVLGHVKLTISTHHHS